MTARRISTLVAVVATAGLWLLLAPTGFGGRSSYVVVSQGISMGSSLRYGDLAVMRRAARYETGDVVAYRDSDLDGRVVIHRVIDRRDGRLTTKGDGNSFVDPFQPSEREILGRMWLRIPHLGAVAIWLRVPINAALTTALIVLLLFGSWPVQERRHRRAHSPARVAHP